MTGNNGPSLEKPMPGASGSPTNNNNNNAGNNTAKVLKVVTIILAVALIVCLGILYSVWNKGKETISMVTSEKEQVTNELLQLRSEYAELRTSNDTINAQLNREKQKIDLLLDKIKRTDASNRAKIKEYEQELGSLRSLLRGYVTQIDSLNNLNQQLKAENTQIKQRANESQKKLEELSQKTDNLQTMVEKGAVIKGRDVMVSAINSKGKDVSKTRQVEKIRTCFTLTGNAIAEKGIRTIYIRIKGPDGSLLTNSPDNLFSKEDGSQLVYSAMREVDFQGDDLEVCIFYTDTEYLAGTYTVEVYLSGTVLGSSQMLLK
ncbi:MAG: hypothetical protein LBL90_06845 [Prevotellaceae bacterium]|jgi:hypothetical protein|nr:hypothetical protein [Prevotellaceae bacterium]